MRITILSNYSEVLNKACREHPELTEIDGFHVKLTKSGTDPVDILSPYIKFLIDAVGGECKFFKYNDQWYCRKERVTFNLDSVDLPRGHSPVPAAKILDLPTITSENFDDMGITTQQQKYMINHIMDTIDDYGNSFVTIDENEN